MLWARGGDAGDGVVTNYAYDQRSTFTPHADELPYLRELIERTADLSRLNFVRLALVAKIVGDHGGVVECDSQSGRTIFRVLLPQARGGES